MLSILHWVKNYIIYSEWYDLTYSIEQKQTKGEKNNPMETTNDFTNVCHVFEWKGNLTDSTVWNTEETGDTNVPLWLDGLNSWFQFRTNVQFNFQISKLKVDYASEKSKHNCETDNLNQRLKGKSDKFLLIAFGNQISMIFTFSSSLLFCILTSQITKHCWLVKVTCNSLVTTVFNKCK